MCDLDDGCYYQFCTRLAHLGAEISDIFFHCNEIISPSLLSDNNKRHRTRIKATLAFISHFLGDNPFTPDAAQCCKMTLVESCSDKKIISDLLP